MSVIKIDAELRACLPPLDAETRSQLEANLIATGRAVDPLTVWRGLLVDGHNRLELCLKNKLPYEVREMEFPDKTAAICWAIRNQLDRRNLTDEQRSYLRGKRYEQEKKAVGRPENVETVTTLPEPARTAEKLATEYGVSEKTIRNDAEFARAVDVIAEKAGPEAKAKVLSGEIPRKDVTDMASRVAEKTPEQLREEMRSAASGKKGRRVRGRKSRERLERVKGEDKTTSDRKIAKIMGLFRGLTKQEQRECLELLTQTQIV